MVSPLIAAALAAAPVFYLSLPPLWLFIAAAPLAALVIFHRKIPGRLLLERTFGSPCFFAAAVFAGLCAGLGSYASMERSAPGLPPERIYAIRGTLLDDPRIFSGQGNITEEEQRGMAYAVLDESRASLPGAGNIRASAQGKALVYFPAGTMPRVKEFGRGAEMYVEGKFLPVLSAPEGGGKDGFIPAKGKSMRFRALSVHTVKAAPPFERFRTALRSALLARLGARPWGALAAALLLGTRESLDGELAEHFRNAGLSHILALSGMHLAFLSGLLAFALKRPLGKNGSILAGLAFVLLYVFLIGPQPSLIRAALMYTLGSCFVLAGFSVRPSELIALSFLLQLLWKPSDALGLSFILSYLALTGILFLGGPLESLLRGRLPPFLAGGLSASLGAFAAAAPVVAACFGALRPAGLVAGLAAAPLSGLFMALALAALTCGSIPLAGPLLGSVLDRALSFLQLILARGIAFFSWAPALSLPLPAICAALPFLAAALIFFARHRDRYRNAFAPFG